MKISDLIQMALRNLTRRKLRAFLTILGVLIGTTSIVVMLSIGIGLNTLFTREIENMGGLNTIRLHPNYEKMNTKPGQEYVEPIITDEDIKNVLALQNVEAVMPFMRIWDIQLQSGKYQAHADVYGVLPDSMPTFGYEVTEGRMITSNDKLEVVIGSKINERFYDPNSRNYDGEPPDIDFMSEGIEFYFHNNTGDTKKPKTYDLNVVGILKEGDWEKDYGIYLNIEHWKEFKEKIEKRNKNKSQDKTNGNRKTNTTGYQEAKAFITDIKLVEQTMEEIKALGLGAYSMAEYLESVKKQMAIVQAVLGGIGGISLFVAAIGITNTMIMAIYERTREIGVMKVIGANIKDIKRLFLIEAALIGFLGGVIGIGFSFGVSVIINHFATGFVEGFGSEEKLSIIPLWLVGASIVFSTFIGIISGYLPARRAMKLSALKAIRTE